MAKLMNITTQEKIEKKRPTLTGKVVLGVNVTLVCVLASFMIWDYYASWDSHVNEKKIALEEEAKILLTSVFQLKEHGDNTLQKFIDNTCGAMQESTSPGHHIVLQLGPRILQAQAHHRASPDIVSAMKEAMHEKDGLASVGPKTIIVGTAGLDDVTVYVSEYLSNIRKIVRTQILRRIISILLVGVLLAIVLNILLHKLIAEPLSRMINAVQRFGQGELNSRITDIPTVELGLFSDEFNRMADTIEAVNIERCKRMEKARMIQRNLLPDLSLMTGMRLKCLFYPASEVAGDYYDIIRFSDGTVLFCIADVIGHDVPAAMSAAMLKALLKTAVERQRDPQKLIHLIHSTFSQVTLEGDFATMMLVRWDPQGSFLEYISAGHEAGYLIRPKSEIRELSSTGPILGIKGLSEWSEEKIIIIKGDRLVMLTDGIIETFSPSGEAFGRKRLIEILEQSRTEPLDLLPDKLMDSIKSFRGSLPQIDDITMLAVELA